VRAPQCASAWALGLVLLALGAFAAGGAAQTVSLETSVTVLMGHHKEIPLVLNSAPAGVLDYAITVQAAEGAVLDIEDVSFPAAFSGTAQVRIAPDRNSVRFSASDAENRITSGDNQVTLAKIGVRGAMNGSTRLLINIARLSDDLGIFLNAAVSNGQVEVKGGPPQDESTLTLVGGHGVTSVDATVAVPLILSQTPSGISEYKATVALENLNQAVIEGVAFVAFNGQPRVEISDDGASVSFSAKDEQDLVRPLARGVVLARAGGLLAMRWRGLPVGRTADVVVPSVALGEGITRIGCFLNGCCFGLACDWPWGVRFPADSAVAQLFPERALHPTQLYASLLGFAGFALLVWWDRRKPFDGAVFAAFLVLLPGARIAVDLVRWYEPQVILGRAGGLHFTMNQAVCLGLVAVGAGILWLGWRRARVPDAA